MSQLEPVTKTRARRIDPERLGVNRADLLVHALAQLPDNVTLESEGGAIFVGDKGILVHNTYGHNPRIYPDKIMEEALYMPTSLPRIDTSHEMNWVNACKGEGKSTSPFEYAAGLTETMCLGVAALRAGQGRKVYYDAQKMEFTNAPDANQFLTREWRRGWEL